jgi:hypothetical protein
MNSAANPAVATLNGITALPLAAAGTRQQSICVATRMNFAATPDEVWERLMFYEQIVRRPPLLLRLLLPVPLRAEGEKSRVGDEVKCRYRDGHLLKRVTRVIRARNYAFQIIEQNLTLGGGIRLSGGDYTLRPSREGRTEIVLQTRYVSPRRPRWLWQPVEAAVCHSFHRHILNAMRHSLASR